MQTHTHTRMCATTLTRYTHTRTRARQVREHDVQASFCFFVLRTDGSAEDFSARKCILRLFPNDAAALEKKEVWGSVAGIPVDRRGCVEVMEWLGFGTLC